MESIYQPRARHRPDLRHVFRHAQRDLGQATVRLGRTWRTSPATFFWLLAWAPYWLGSNSTPPRRTWRRPPSPEAHRSEAAGVYLATRIDRFTRLVGVAWLIGSMVRGIVLTLTIVAAWLVLAAVTSLPAPTLPAGIGIGIACLVLGIIHGWLIWPTRAQTTRMLDRTFALHERMVTAFERPITHSRISRIQLADAANTWDEVAESIARTSWLPIRELVLCLILAGALVTVMLATVPGNPIAAATDAPVPQFLTASERMSVPEQAAPQPPLTDAPAADQASIADIQERGRTSQQAREDLGKLAEALNQYPLTQPAAESIGAGDYAGAADLLRIAAESVSTMDQASREAMADDLDLAAQEMSGSNPDLAQATRDAAAALRDGGPEAAQSLDNLADQIEATGEQVESQADLAQELDEATGGSSAPATDSPAGDEGEPGDTSQQGNAQAGDQQAVSDPGQGAAANPGVIDQAQPGDPGASSGSDTVNGTGDEGAGSEPSEGTGDQADGTGDQADGTGSDGGDGQASQPGPGGGGDPSQQQPPAAASEDDSSASQGAGAGTGQSDSGDPDAGGTNDQAGPVEDPEAAVPGAGEAGEPPPSSERQGNDQDGRGQTSPGSGSLQLQGTSDDSVQSGGDSGTASTGSGSDSATAGGDLAAGNPGAAGPDSNRVPAALRDIVRDYFEGPSP